MSNKKTEISIIYERGLDRRNRRVYFGVLGDDNEASFSWNSVSLAIRNLHVLVNDSSTKPIELHMHSPGGEAYAMLHLIDEILSCPCQIKFFGGGQISSAATWVMAVCDERNLLPNTTIMLHDGSEYIEGKHTDVQIEAFSSKNLQDKLNKLLADNSYMPENFWSDILQRDLYVTAEEAVELGIADNVIQYKKRGNLRKSRIAKMSVNKNPSKIKRLIKDLYKRTNRKTINKIDISLPKKEEYDPNIIVDNNDISFDVFFDKEDKDNNN